MSSDDSANWQTLMTIVHQSNKRYWIHVDGRDIFFRVANYAKMLIDAVQSSQLTQILVNYQG
jgi:hypothetical protein